jgi:hypothetical protein
MGHMKNYRQLLKELPSNKVVFAFGRFQPPTAIHELQVKVVKKLAEQQRADYVIYASKDLKEELLPVDKKVHYMNLMFPNTNIQTTDASTFVEAVKTLNKKYKNIVMVSSADCKEDYEKILNKKNGTEFFFETIEVVAAGDKDPDENKLRESAKKGDYAKFKSALPAALREIDSRRLMNDMRQGLGLDMVKEEIKLVKDELREQYFRGEIFNIGEFVESAGQQYEIIKRGSNHLLLKEESGKLVSKWIQDVTVVKETTDSPVVNKNSTFNIAKDVMRYKDFKKLNAMAKGQVKEQKEAEEPSEMEEFLKTISGTVNKPTGEAMGSRDDQHRRRKVAYNLGEGFSEDEVQMIDELSTELLGRYKKAAGEQASAADKVGNYAKGDKRFKGINKATNKQFDNDLKKHGQYQKEELNISEDIKKEYDSLKKNHDIKSLRGLIKTQHKIIDTSEFKTKDHAISHYLRSKHGDKKVAAAFGLKEGIPHIGPVNTNKVNHAGDEPHDEEWEDTGICMEHGKKDCHDCSTELEEAKKKKEKTGDEFKPTAVQVKMRDDDYQLGANNAHGFDAFFNEEEMEPSEEEKDFSEEEIDKMIDSLTDDDFLEAYDDDELAVVDDETGEEMDETPEVTEQAILEVLSRMERMRARVRFAKSKSKRERSAKLALKRTSSTGTINKRARRLAVNLMKKRLMRGRPASSLSVGEKERIEKMVEKRRPILNRIAMKLTSRVRQVEKARLHHTKFTQSGSSGVSV